MKNHTTYHNDINNTSENPIEDMRRAKMMEEVSFDYKDMFKFIWGKYQSRFIMALGIIIALFLMLSLILGGDDSSKDNDNTLPDQNNEINQNNPDQDNPNQNTLNQNDLNQNDVNNPSDKLHAYKPGCDDTDYGISTNKLGFVYYGTNSSCITKKDRCVNYKQLEEYYCEANMVKSTIISCNNGCNLGECAPITYKDY